MIAGPPTATEAVDKSDAVVVVVCSCLSYSVLPPPSCTRSHGPPWWGHLAPKARGARARKHEQMKKGGGTASAGKPTDSFSYNVFQVSLLLRYACARRESLT